MVEASSSARESEPDYRYTLANERTMLSWLRTSLALMAGGIALKAFAEQLQPAWFPVVTGLIATLLGAVVAVLGYVHWRQVQQAMRRGEPLPAQVAAPVLTVGVVLLALALAVGIIL